MICTYEPSYSQKPVDSLGYLRARVMVGCDHVGNQTLVF